MNYLYKIFFMAFTFLLFSLTKISAAQHAPEDPLNKPQIWIKLQNMPEDSVLWTMYVGKPWVSMTMGEKEKIGEWKTSLYTVAEKRVEENLNEMMVAEDDRSFWNIPTDETANFNDQRQIEEQTNEAQYFAQLEDVMLQESSRLSDLKSNIKANFPLIEDVYFEEFAQQGVNYQYYSQAHPKGNYSINLWVEDKTEELRKLKQKEFAKMKAQLTSSTR